MNAIEQGLLEQLERFTAFARQRLGDPELAADVVQASLARALAASTQLRDEERLVAWFYRILRRAIVDAHRKRAADRRLQERLAAMPEEGPDAATERELCACLERLLPTLRPEYAALIRQLDLGDASPESVASALGVTPNNLRVRHHRARQQLRERLEQTCRLCARHGCLDCHCDPATPV